MYLILLVLLLIITVPQTNSTKAYPIGCANKPPSYYDYENSYPWPPPKHLCRSANDFWVVRRLGSGKFSDVFEAVDTDKVYPTHEVDPNTLVVIKCLKPVAPRKIRRELLVLTHASNLPNLARLRGIVCFDDDGEGNDEENQQQRMPALVLDHAGPSSRWFCHGTGKDHLHSSSSPKTVSNSNDSYYLSTYEIKYFLYHLLIALDSLHSRGIMHRDVKPRNILITRSPPTVNNHRHRLIQPNSSTTLMLIDLGLADFYLPGKRYNVRVASRHYKAPELLVGDMLYDYAVDMWGVGCVLAGLLLRREPFFRGRDNIDQLVKIVQVLGTHDLIDYLRTRGLTLEKEVKKVLWKNNGMGYSKQRRDWREFVARGDDTEYVPPEDGLDLLDKLLVYNHEKRWTAREAMSHPFFDQVRNEIELEHRMMTKWKN